MRIFIAVDIPGDVRTRLAEYIARVKSYAPESRWARVEGLHVTIKFVGEVKDPKVEEIKRALATVKPAPFDVTFQNIGFFPGSKSPRVFWAGVQGGDILPALARDIDQKLSILGIAREEKEYHPHLTLARAGARDPHSLKALAPLLTAEPAPHFGTMTAREFWLYRSQPGPGGSKYTKLERYELK